MVKFSKSTIFLSGLILCTLFLTGIAEEQNSPQSAEKKEKDQFENARISVQASVVEVKLDALYKAGVSPVGQKPNAVSVDHILKCLKNKDDAKVTAGAIVSVKQKERGEIKEEQRIYVERTNGGSRSFENYIVGKEFAVGANVISEGKIRVFYNFNQTSPIIPDANDVPPNSISRKWENSTTLEPGKPAIVGAAQDANTAVFLILSADIESR
jgi:hypothetical protein